MQHRQGTSTAQGGLPAIPGDRLLRLPEVLHTVGLSRTGWLARVKDGGAPQPIKDNGATFWRMSELQQWIATRPQTARRSA